MNKTYKLTYGRIMVYASGMVGWSILINMVSVMLIYFYLPPLNSGLDPLIPDRTYLRIFSVLALIAAGGRLFDAVTDPLIAWMSDRAKFRRGRRIPFMRFGWYPAFLFCLAVFLPLKHEQSWENTLILSLSLTLFYLFVTVYFIPYNALMPELAPGARDKIRLSTWLSLAFVSGIILAAQTPGLAGLAERVFHLESRILSFQAAIGFFAVLAGIFLAIPAFLIREDECCRGAPATVPFRTSLIQALGNRNFRLFLFADFSYFMAVAMIASGMLYYLRVLLGLEEAMSGGVFGIMIGVSLLFYPLVVQVSKRVRKKYMISTGLVIMGGVFLGIYYLGKLPLHPKLQIYLFALVASLPVAILGIIPYAVIAEVAQLDCLETGMGKEGMYFAVRNFFYKLGMTTGIVSFTVLTLWGKDPGNDLGIRLTGLLGAGLCLIAGIVFLGYDEKGIQQEIGARMAGR